MSDADTAGPAPAPPGPKASVPEGLISAVVNLVSTGPVLLGAYTIAELTAVDAITTQGSAEIAGASTDLILARHNGRVHAFSRDPLNRAKLVSGRRDGKDIRDMLADLLT
jgi:hypothetical protein